MIDRVETEMVDSRLSHSSWGDSPTRKASSFKSVDNHIVSEAAFASARYSTSVVDRQMALSFYF